MNWWNSYETLSKLQTGFAILVTILGIVTLTFKVRADHLKKAADARRSEERARLDKELQDKTAEALHATSALEAKQAQRRFSMTQIAALQQILSSFPERPKLTFWYRQPDSEAEAFANHIADIVTNVGFRDGELNGRWGLRIPPGLTLNSAHPNQALRETFERAFLAAGVALRQQSFEASDPGAPILVIGSKP
jgi:hypothetical protein